MAEFRRCAEASMSAAERAKKKRVRLSLFPEKHAPARKQDVARKLEAKCVCSPKHSVMCWACETKAERERLAESGYSLHF